MRGAVLTASAASFVLAVVACDTPFTDAGCALDTPDHEIDVKRDVPIEFAAVPKLKVEACATREGQTPTCTIVRPLDGIDAGGDLPVAIGLSTDAAHGKFLKAADGKTKLELIVHLGEGEADTTTRVVVKVLDEADKELAKAEGDIRWSDASCNRQPDKKSI